MGFTTVYPGLKLLREGRYKGALAGARNSWDNVTVLLLVNGMFDCFLSGFTCSLLAGVISIVSGAGRHVVVCRLGR